MNPNPADYIAKWGGKIGGHLFLKSIGGFEQHLPEALFLGPDEGYERIRGMATELGMFPVIVRGSHPNDHEGLVDVLETETAGGEGVLEGVIRKIRENANCEAVHSYSRYEGRPYDGKTRIMVARETTDLDKYFEDEESVAAMRGNAIEHPHQKGTYFVDIVYPVDFGDLLFHFLLRGGRVLQQANDYRNPNFSFDRKKIGEILSLYRKVRDSGFIGSDWSFQMEFGWSENPHEGKANLQFYQARPFKKFEDRTFKLYTGENLYNCFGMTERDGIVLPVKKVFPFNRDNDAEFQGLPHEYALVPADFYRVNAYPLTLQPRGMKAYVPASHESSGAMLEHLHFRFVRKADITVFDVHPNSIFDNIRIISDGVSAIAEKAKPL